MIHRKLTLGWTFIEALISLSVLALFISMSYPSFQIYLQKSRRTDFMQSLYEDQDLLEQCYAQNQSYIKACKQRPSFPHPSKLGFYTIQSSKPTDNTYTLIATPKKNQKKDTQCALMTINEIHQKTALNASSKETNTCWM